MHTNFWQLGLRTFWRDVRSGELRLLVLAVTLAVAALTAVGFVADRIKGGLQRDALQLLGGDAVVASDTPLPQRVRTHAEGLGLQAVQTLSFPTMARVDESAGGATRLVALKVVEPGYPLRGSLRTAPAPGQAGTAVRAIPGPGEVWVEGSLLEALDTRVGEALLLGNARLRVGAVLTHESDRGAGFMNFAPRVMLHAADLGATALVQPASRINYRLAVAGSPGAVQDFVTWMQAQINPGDAAQPGLRGVRVETLQAGRPEMGQTLDRAEKFLSLVALLAALLCAVAVALAARAFAARHLDDCAMLRVLGLPQRTMTAAYVLEMGLAGVLASAAGALLGFGVQALLIDWLAGLIESGLPLPGWGPWLLGMGMGLCLLLAFGLPPILQLARVPALRVIRRDVGQLKPASAGVLALGMAGFASLLLVASADLTLGAITVGGFALAVGLFAALSWLALQLLRRLVQTVAVPSWLALTVRQMVARSSYTVVQVCALAIGLLALVLLVLLRTDLIDGWRKATPADAPNRFVINIMPEQGPDFERYLHSAGVQGYDWYPMIRGRLVAVNDKTVSVDDYQGDRARRLVDREFNISHRATLPAHNVLSAGRWVDDEADGVSVEEGIATTLGLRLGDLLRFDIGGVSAEGRVTSLRKVDWGSMRANFFVLFPRASMPDLPATYMAAYRAPQQPRFDSTLVAQFPNVTNVDMSANIAQIQRVLDQVIGAVEFLFGFALAAGLLVLFAAVSATREERTREFAIMRSMGARAALLRRIQGAELLGVGLLAGLLAALVASVVGWALARWVFEFAWAVSLWVPVLGSLSGGVLALAAGWWALREVLQRPVIETLRQAR